MVAIMLTLTAGNKWLIVHFTCSQFTMTFLKKEWWWIFDPVFVTVAPTVNLLGNIGKVVYGHFDQNWPSSSHHRIYCWMSVCALSDNGPLWSLHPVWPVAASLHWTLRPCQLSPEMLSDWNNTQYQVSKHRNTHKSNHIFFFWFNLIQKPKSRHQVHIKVFSILPTSWSQRNQEAWAW